MTNHVVRRTSIYILLVVCSLASCIRGKDPSGDSKASIIIPDDFKKYPALILHDWRRHSFSRIEEDRGSYYLIRGRTRIENQSKTLIQNNNGLDEYGQFESRMINGNIKHYSIDITLISPLGKKRKYGKGDFQRIDSGEGEYQFRFAYPSLEVGSEVHIEESYTLYEYPPTGWWDFGAEVPKLRSELIFRIPKGSIVRHKMTPDEVITPHLEEGEERYFDAYYFSKTNVPPYPDEPFMAHELVGSPTLTYYVPLQSWEKVSEQFLSYFNETKWDDDEGYVGHSQATLGIMEEFRQSVEKPEDRLDTYVNLFHEKFSLKKGSRHNIPRGNPETVFNTKIGDQFELAYALRVLLTDVGLPSSVIMTNDSEHEPIDVKVPGYYEFTRVLLCLEDQETYYWIDPACKYCSLDEIPASSQGRLGLSLEPSGKVGIRTVPIDPASYNLLKTVTDIDIEQNKTIKAKTKSSLSGQYLLAVRQLVKAIEESDDTARFVDYMNEINYDSLVGIYDIEVSPISKGTLNISYMEDSPSWIDTSGDYVQIDLHESLIKALFGEFSKSKRISDIHYPFPYKQVMVYTMDLPDGCEVAGLPNPVEIENECYKYSCMVNHDDGIIECLKVFSIMCKDVPVADFEQTKTFFQQVYDYDSQPIVLKLGPGN